MRKFSTVFIAIIFGILCSSALLVSCVSRVEFNDFYVLDTRYYDLPVMLNDIGDKTPGRQFHAQVKHSSSVSTSTYSGYGYSVSVTTTRERESSYKAQDQILSRSVTADQAIYVKGVGFYRHLLMAPYYGENSVQMDVPVLYLKEINK